MTTERDLNHAKIKRIQRLETDAHIANLKDRIITAAIVNYRDVTQSALPNLRDAFIIFTHFQHAIDNNDQRIPVITDQWKATLLCFIKPEYLEVGFCTSTDDIVEGGAVKSFCTEEDALQGLLEHVSGFAVKRVDELV